MKFVQIIEYETARPAEMEAVFNEWLTATEGKRTASRELHTQDKDNPGRFMDIVEFPSYEAAMANSELPETATFAERLMELCDGPIVFRNLDVQSVTELA